MRLYHVSTRDFGDEMMFYPCSIDRQGETEESLPPRVCAAPSIECCFASIRGSMLHTREECKGQLFITLYVYQFDDSEIIKFQKADASKVLDAEQTQEHYALVKVHATLVEKIIIESRGHYRDFNKIVIERSSTN